ncbi:hypothetical protein DL762_005133 [Monosporascus cannonballus]|uniref:Heterokaryon incompatibility domain-containing protein n=1 Tax=Monosporascus cannonballus TaxID=155416 RepID=A0ABY0HA20_9PEZI|nr:hypothetical protein DL762_005133 [Monosporascus cannonballus]
MSGNSFRYLPLDPERREIRILTLQPGGFEEPLRCSITTADLDTSPVYNALSYVWGAPSSSNIPGNTVLLDGHPFPVTTNLLMALRHLRPPAGAGATALWVDAVCINQQDLDERRHQVTMMRDIYASAERVIIWLGEEDAETDVLDSLPLLAAQSRHQGVDPKRDQHLVDLMRRCTGFFFGLAVRRPWFSRVWIIQELAMARQDPLVVCGRKSVPWSTLMKAWSFLARATFTEIGMVRRKGPQGGSRRLPGGDLTGEDPEETGGGDIEVLAMIKIDVLDDLYTTIRSQGGESLRKLLMISRSSEATDPRDRIYALLGLLKPDALEAHSEDAIIVDYRKTASEVYTDAMAYIFAQGDGPYFLSYVFLPGVSAPAPHIPGLPSMAKQPDLPSWVPDFSRQGAGKATQPRGDLFHPPAGPGASGAGAGCKNGKRLEDGRTLQIEGLFVDTIEQVVPLGTTIDAYIAQLPELESLASAARQRPCRLGSSVAPLVEEFRGKEPLWRALIANKHFLSGYDPAPSSYEAAYCSLLKQSPKRPKLDGEAGRAQPSDYEQRLRANVGKQSFFTTRSGFVGTCVPDSLRGDIIAILFGSPVPFVLRPAAESIGVAESDRPSYLLVGASYVSGIMNGEMVDELYCEDLMDSTTFFIR